MLKEVPNKQLQTAFYALTSILFKDIHINGVHTFSSFAIPMRKLCDGLRKIVNVFVTRCMNFVCLNMGNDHKHKSNKDSKKKSKKEHKKHKKSKRQNSDSEPEIDYSDPSLWVEKESDVPPPATSAPEEEEVKSAQPSAGPRHGWMLSDSFDFGSLGTARQPTEESKPKPDPDEVCVFPIHLDDHCSRWADLLDRSRLASAS